MMELESEPPAPPDFKGVVSWPQGSVPDFGGNFWKLLSRNEESLVSLGFLRTLMGSSFVWGTFPQG